MRRSLFPAVLALALVATGAQAQEFSSLEERMSAAEFKAAGLDKLSAEELAALNAWLGREVDETAQAVAATRGPATPVDRRGFEGAGHDYSDIETRIAGEFTGWDGRDGRFVLTNGQVWQSVDPGSRLAGVKLDSPLVRIEPGAFNSWYLTVEGYNTRVKVRRVK